MVTVARDEVVAVRGSKANPITNGAICAKVAHYYPDFVHGSSRLRHPLKRIGAKGEGKFERISWDEALEIIHSRVVDITAVTVVSAATAQLRGPTPDAGGRSMSLRFFTLGASLLSCRPCGRSAAKLHATSATPANPQRICKPIIKTGETMPIAQSASCGT
jgi:anaerobic selenocysteine-containing dehydrogenase